MRRYEVHSLEANDDAEIRLCLPSLDEVSETILAPVSAHLFSSRPFVTTPHRK